MRFAKIGDNAGRVTLHTLLTGFLLVFFLWFVIILVGNVQNLGNLVRVVSIVRSQHLYSVTTEQLVDGAIKGLVESLEDPYSAYLDPAHFAGLQEQIKGYFGGLGILVGVRNDNLTVVRTYQETPAHREGIKEGDMIIGIDDQEAIGMELDTAVSLMRGQAGTQVSLLIDRPGEDEPLFFTITREIISVPTVETQAIEGTEIWHVTVSQFTERTGREMQNILDQIQNEQAQGIILDLRDNPGGELNAAVEVAGYFIPQGPVVYIDDRAGREQVLEAHGPTVQLPLVVLINEGSASASEILAGAIQDTDSGVLVGASTFGKAVVQTVFRLGDGAGLRLTTAHYLTPARNDINEKGIEPDYPVEQDRGNYDDDPQLDKALEIIRKMIADESESGDVF